jgi:hypothetical protein
VKFCSRAGADFEKPRAFGQHPERSGAQAREAHPL